MTYHSKACHALRRPKLWRRTQSIAATLIQYAADSINIECSGNSVY